LQSRPEWAVGNRRGFLRERNPLEQRFDLGEPRALMLSVLELLGPDSTRG
jgi:hypothetical protein